MHGTNSASRVGRSFEVFSVLGWRHPGREGKAFYRRDAETGESGMVHTSISGRVLLVSLVSNFAGNGVRATPAASGIFELRFSPPTLVARRATRVGHPLRRLIGINDRL